LGTLNQVPIYTYLKQAIDTIIKEPQNNLNFSQVRYITKKNPLEVPHGDTVESIPAIPIKSIDSNNFHSYLHNSRVYLLTHALLKHTSSYSTIDLSNRRIATISNAAGLSHLFPYGNYFINQAYTDEYSDLERISKTYLECINEINNHMIQPPISKTQIIVGDRPALASYPKKTNVENPFTLLNKNICHCTQKDDLCEHILEFNPEILLLPHSIYYMSKQFINNVLARGIVIIYVAHIFNPMATSGSIQSHVTTTDEIDVQTNNKEEFKLPNNYTVLKKITANKHEQITVAEWEKKNGCIDFKITDEKFYHHQDVLNYLFDTSVVENKKGINRVMFRIKDGDCHHIAGVMKGEYIDYIRDQGDAETLILTRDTRIETAMEITRKGNLSLLEVENDQKILLKKIYGKRHLMQFSVGTLGQKLSLKWKKLFNSSQNSEILASDFYDFFINFQIEFPNQIVILDNQIYNNLVNYADEVDFTNEAEVDNFRKIVKRFFPQVTNPTTIRTIAFQVIKEVIFGKIITRDIMQSNFLRLFKSKFTAGNELSLFSKLMTKVVKKEINLQDFTLKQVVPVEHSFKTQVENTKQYVKTDFKAITNPMIAKAFNEVDVKKRDDKLIKNIEGIVKNMKTYFLHRLILSGFKFNVKREIVEDEDDEGEAMISTTSNNINNNIYINRVIIERKVRKDKKFEYEPATNKDIMQLRDLITKIKVNRKSFKSNVLSLEPDRYYYEKEQAKVLNSQIQALKILTLEKEITHFEPIQNKINIFELQMKVMDGMDPEEAVDQMKKEIKVEKNKTTLQIARPIEHSQIVEKQEQVEKIQEQKKYYKKKYYKNYRNSYYDNYNYNYNYNQNYYYDDDYQDYGYNYYKKKKWKKHYNNNYKRD
jgi:hypothetical protein